MVTPLSQDPVCEPVSAIPRDKPAIIEFGSGKGEYSGPRVTESGRKYITCKYPESSTKPIPQRDLVSLGRSKACPTDVVIEAYGGADCAVSGNFDIESRGTVLDASRGLDSGFVDNRICVQFMIMVSCCENYSFGNAITNAQYRIFKRNGDMLARLRATVVPSTDGDKSVVWPRAVTIATRKMGPDEVPHAALFVDNPGFQSYLKRRPKRDNIPARDAREAWSPGQKLSELISVPKGAPPGYEASRVEEGMVVNDETDFISSIICNEDYDPFTELPDRPKAERHVAMVRWGYKLQLVVGKTWRDNRGKAYIKPVKIVCVTEDTKEKVELLAQVSAAGLLGGSGSATYFDYNYEQVRR